MKNNKTYETTVTGARVCDVCRAPMTCNGVGMWHCIGCGKNQKEVVMCENCGNREATLVWSNSSMGYVHGMYESWCEICCVEEQLKFAKKQANRIPELEKKLKELNIVEGKLDVED